MENHHSFHGQINYFDWAIFQVAQTVSHYQRDPESMFIFFFRWIIHRFFLAFHRLSPSIFFGPQSREKNLGESIARLPACLICLCI